MKYITLFFFPHFIFLFLPEKVLIDSEKRLEKYTEFSYLQSGVDATSRIQQIKLVTVLNFRLSAFYSLGLDRWF